MGPQPHPTQTILTSGGSVLRLSVHEKRVVLGVVEFFLLLLETSFLPLNVYVLQK